MDLKRLFVLSSCWLFFIPGKVWSQHEQVIENVETFAKVYGYVRFFHPSDEAAAVDWDKLAIYGCQRVEKAHNPEELKTALQEIFQPIAPTIQFYNSKNIPAFQVKDITPPDLSGYKVITWQHLGVSFGNKKNVYRSARTNRPHIFKEEGGFGTLTTFIEAKPYRNKEFKFTASVKNAANEGAGFLWARVDLENNKTGFFDNMNDRPIQKKDWAVYEITGKIDAKAEQLYFGSFLTGTGRIVVDNFKLLIKEESGWTEVYANSFETDQTGEFPQSFLKGNSALKNQPGYTFQVSSESAVDGKKSVSIEKKASPPEANSNDLFAEKARIGEYIQEEIGNGLTCMLPIALYGKKDFTFPQAPQKPYTVLQTSLSEITDRANTGNNLYIRLADLVITWNIFQHFYPYFDVAKTDWKANFTQALKQTYPDQTDADFLLTLRQFTAPLKDGHIWVNSPADKKYFLPAIAWEWVENQLVITHVFNDSLPVKRGDVVTAIDQQNPKRYFEAQEVYISAATKGYLQSRSKHTTLTGTAHSVMQVQVKDAQGNTRTHALPRNVHPQDYYSLQPKADSARLISPTVVYLNLDRISMGGITKLMPDLEKAKTIICDLRGYPKGNHGFISHLLSQKDTASHWMQIPKIIYPDQKKIAGYQTAGWQLEPTKPHLQAKVIFITDGSAISYAESYMGFIEGYKLATIIGQATAGTNGNINPFTLPGQYTISWTGMKVLKHNGSPHHGVGIQPNLYLTKTIQGVREGRDEFLEKAIELANAK